MTDKRIKEWFEANYLDGNEVQYGQMLSSNCCLEAIADLRKIEEEKMLTEEEIIKIITKSDLFYMAKSWCENQCRDDKNFPYGKSFEAKIEFAHAICEAQKEKRGEK